MASTKRTYSVTFDVDGTSVTVADPESQAIVHQILSYTAGGFPKMLKVTDSDTGVINWYSMKCICNVTATPTVEDVDPRPCEQIDCIPDAGPANTNPAT